MRLTLEIDIPSQGKKLFAYGGKTTHGELLKRIARRKRVKRVIRSTHNKKKGRGK